MIHSGGPFKIWTNEGMVFDFSLYEYIQDIKTTFIGNLCLTVFSVIEPLLFLNGQVK